MAAHPITPAELHTLLTSTPPHTGKLATVRTWAARIGGRYMGQNRAEEFGARNGVPGELLVRLRPTNTTGMADLAD